MLVSPPITSVHGRLRSITGTDPAVNTEINETVPDRRRWKILSLHYSLTTDATGADRYPHLVFDDGTNILTTIPTATPQTASLTWEHNFANINTPETLVGTRLFIPIPSITLPPGFRIRTTTSNRQAGDNFSAPQLLIEEWIDP